MRQFLLRMAWWIPTLGLVLIATQTKSPLLFAWRTYEWVGVLGGGLVGLASTIWLLRRGHIGRREAGALTVACGLALAFAGTAELRLRADRAAVLAAGPSLQVLGARFIVGFSQWDEAALLAERGLIGGIYLAARNVRGMSVADVKAAIDGLQSRRARAGLPPLLIAADQEGGAVSHMSPPLTTQPALGRLLRDETATLQQNLAHAYGTRQGRELAALGVNINFGPVADLTPAHGKPTFDKYTRLDRRALSSDPATAARIARAYGQGLLSAGVLPTFKHFPGLGRVGVDTHFVPGQIDAPIAELAATDWLPFRQAPPGAAIMLSHATVAAIDPRHPASLSPAMVRLLRNTWGFDGLLVTDDLNMGAVYRYGICDATLAALAAGVDLLLVAYDPDQYYGGLRCAAAALGTGRLNAESLSASQRHILSKLPRQL